MVFYFCIVTLTSDVSVLNSLWFISLISPPQLETEFSCYCKLNYLVKLFILTLNSFESVGQSVVG